MSKGHWTERHPKPGHQLAVVLGYNNMPMIVIVKTARKRGRCTASVPFNRIVCFWSVQCRIK